MEVQQMKAEAEERKNKRLVEKQQLVKEREAREDAQREKSKMAQKLEKFRKASYACSCLPYHAPFFVL